MAASVIHKLIGRANTIRRLLKENSRLRRRLFEERKAVLWREKQWGTMRRYLHTPSAYRRPEASFLQEMQAADRQAYQEIYGAGE